MRPRPIAFVDVHYDSTPARAACALAHAWSDAAPFSEWICDIVDVAPYQPGRFFERELPCIARVLAEAPELPARELPAVLVIDGYVVLDQHGAPGLGSHVFDYYAGKLAVIGIAKTSYQGSAFALPVLRGDSHKPLFVTARGLPASEAAEHVKRMHGAHRVPTLCTRVDQLSRGLIQPATHCV